MLADSSCPNRLRVLRSQGLPAKGLFEVYRGVVIAKLLYAASAWWGFTSADDKQRLAAFIRRSIRQDNGFCAPDFANYSYIIYSADDDLFKQILSNPNHVFAPLLSDKTESHYSHDRQLISKLTKLYDSIGLGLISLYVCCINKCIDIQ